MAGRGRRKAQIKLLNEIKTQLILQAERWGREGQYNSIFLEEMELDQCQNILGDLLSEKANLEYELHMLDSNKEELLIKLERLEAYINKARMVIRGHKKNINRSLEKMITDRDKLAMLKKRMSPENSISVLISSN